MFNDPSQACIEYRVAISQDYPSISQLSHKITEKKVNIIFAVTKSQLPTYEKLSNMIEGSTSGELAEDSANIVELVRDNYLVGWPVGLVLLVLC